MINQITAFLGIFYLLFQIILAILFIPKEIIGLGLYGYAIALTIPSIFYLIFSSYFSKEFLDIQLSINIFIHQFLAIFLFICGVTFKFIMQNFIPNQLFMSILSTVFVFILFIIIFYTFNQIDKDDLKFIKELLKLKNYRKVLIKELSLKED